MLRSTIATSASPVYSAAWSPDSNAILYGSGKDLNIVPLQSGSKRQGWQAHDATILKVDWSPVKDLIISGAEDCRYKVSSASMSSTVHDLSCNLFVSVIFIAKAAIVCVVQMHAA